MKTYCIFSLLVFSRLFIPAISHSYYLNINNHSFEAVTLSPGEHVSSIPGWDYDEGCFGTFSPSTASYYSMFEDQGYNVAYSVGCSNYLRQNLGTVLQENTRYIIRAYIGNPWDSNYPANGYLFNLTAGGTPILQIFKDPEPLRGHFVAISKVKDIPAGYIFAGKPLGVELFGFAPGEVNFDNIRVEAIPLSVPGKAYVFGIVYTDNDSNGIYDYTSEYILPDVTITLKKDGVPQQTTWSDNAGFYSFMVTNPGLYEVVETNPPYYMSTTADNVLVLVVLGQNTQVNFGDFADQNPYYIYGTVFDDLDGNGAWDSGEPPLSGVNLELTDGSQTWQRASGGDGFYIFTVTDPGAYIINEHDPAGYFSTTPNQRSFNVGGFQSYYEASFGDQTTTDPYYIHGVVFNDINSNGHFDGNEPCIAGVTVQLSGPASSSAVTDAVGYYLFSVMDTGSYTVQETDPTNFTSSTSNDVNVNVSAAVTEYVVDFGDVPIMPAYVIRGKVFNDLNLNGLPDLHEPGIKDVVVQLQDGSTTLNTTSDTTGLYSFTVNSSGTYTLTEYDLSGFLSTTANQLDVEVFISTYLYEKNFGDTQQIGNCFVDFDHDGDVDGFDLSVLLQDGVAAASVLPFSEDFGRIDCN